MKEGEEKEDEEGGQNTGFNASGIDVSTARFHFIGCLACAFSSY
jgi:hypothetical protein